MTPTGRQFDDSLWQQVQHLARTQDFALCGIAPAQPSEHAQAVRQWIAQGRHGEMGYLKEHLEMRLDPGVLVPGARSLICVADFYAHDRPQPTHESDETPRGRIARYAWGDDYHKVLKKRLFRMADGLKEQFSDHEFRCTVDTAPILEREHAQRAGLGWTGKHTLLIHPRFGSWMLLGLIVTTLELPSAAQSDYPLPLVPPSDRCGSCTRCIDACPTQCISPHEIDARRCISYLTLEHRSLIPVDLHATMGDWVAGCDVCQEVCPYNGGARTSWPGRDSPAPNEGESAGPREGSLIHLRYTPRPLSQGVSLFEMLGWSTEQRQQTFQGSALKRMKLEMVKRNALIAAGNALLQKENPALRQRIEALAVDDTEHELVRQTAHQVLQRLKHAADQNSTQGIMSGASGQDESR